MLKPSAALYVGTYLILASFAAFGVVTSGWDLTVWTFLGLGVLMAVLHIGSWFRDWWTTNLLRNRLAAKRRLRQERRGQP